MSPGRVGIAGPRMAHFYRSQLIRPLPDYHGPRISIDEVRGPVAREVDSVLTPNSNRQSCRSHAAGFSAMVIKPTLPNKLKRGIDLAHLSVFLASVRKESSNSLSPGPAHRIGVHDHPRICCTDKTACILPSIGSIGLVWWRIQKEASTARPIVPTEASPPKVGWRYRSFAGSLYCHLLSVKRG